MSQRISFEDQISRNKIKSFLLITLVAIFFVLLGYIVSLFFDPSYFFVIMIISIIFSLSYTLFSYYNSANIAISSVRAKPASPTIHRAFFAAAENMALAAGLPKPKLYVMESTEINAFASGRSPNHAVICVTTGALAKLDKQELEGVIAHEMAHIANYDIRYMTLATVMIGMISILAEIFLRSLWLSDDKNNKNALFLILGILFSILAPILAQLVSLALSRRREFLADATGVKLTRYPQGLASALRKIKVEHVSRQEMHRYPKAMTPLFISDPLKRSFQNLFATHPNIDERIRRIESM